MTKLTHSENGGFSRSKDPEIKEMADALAEFERFVLAYTGRLRAELKNESTLPEPDESLALGLERQVALVEALAQIIDVDIWDHMILIANLSASLSHRRTRQFY